MRVVLKIIIYCCLFSCSTTHLKFIRATSQKWASEQGDISGTNYHIVLKTLCDSNILKIKSLCIESKNFTNFNLSVLGKSNTYYNYSKGDSILISINIVDKEISNRESCNCYRKDKINISYFYKNKLHNINTKTIQILQSL